jgi:NADPH:quinone reductase
MTMLAVGFERYGPPEVLKVVTLDDLSPPADHVRVRVRAATVNPADVQYRAGKYAEAVAGAAPPLVAGLEFAGEVELAGDDTRWRRGDRVVGMTKFIPDGRGCHAEQVVVHADSLAQLPKTGSFAEYATIPMSGLTARQTLDRLALDPGDTLVVAGAGGAVGAYIVQLASAAGIDVVGIAGPHHEEFVRGCGASSFVARGERALPDVADAHPAGVDAVADLAIIGEPVTQVLKPGGSVASFKPYEPGLYTSVEPIVVSARRYLREPDKLAELVALAADDRLALRVGAVVPFSDAADAHRLVERGGLHGRIVLSFA